MHNVSVRGREARAETVSGGRSDPRPARSRAAILDAALQHFLEHGYLASTIEGIAADAGVAKRTVYNLFPTKDQLFRAVVGQATETSSRFVTERTEAPVGLGELDAEITEFALTHARTVLTPRVLATRRLLIGERHHFPELASEYFDRVPSAVMAAIAVRLGRYAALGVLDIPDPRIAAEHFAYLVLGATLDRALFQPDALDPASVDRAAAAGADAFLRSYRVSSSPRGHGTDDTATRGTSVATRDGTRP